MPDNPLHSPLPSEPELLKAVVEGTARATGDHFFPVLVQKLAEALKVRLVLVTQNLTESPGWVQTLGIWMDGEAAGGFCYALEGTPCEVTHREGQTYIPRGLIEAFPKDRLLADLELTTYFGVPFRDHRGEVIGHLCLMDDKPLPDPGTAGFVLSVFANRAAAELDRIFTQRRLDLAHDDLVETALLIGRGEIAAGVLHNVGNVMNSLNTNLAVMNERVEDLNQGYPLKRLGALLQAALPDFLANDEKGKRILPFINGLHNFYEDEKERMLDELAHLNADMDHVRSIIEAHKFRAEFDPDQIWSLQEIICEAIRINAARISRNQVNIIRHFQDIPPVSVDKHVLLQILVNLINNAVHALKYNAGDDREVTLTLYQSAPRRICVTVADNGSGVEPRNLERIFRHGFTTRKDGQGFGLSSSATLARQLGGRLTAASDGAGRGSTFSLDLPLHEPVSGETDDEG